jgi:N-acetylmuramoyl-L-alanine amidase
MRRRWRAFLCLTLSAFLGPLSLAAQDIPMTAALARLGAELEWNPLDGRGRVSHDGKEIEFISGSNIAVFGSREKRELAVPYLDAGNLLFPQVFLDAAKSYFEAPKDLDRFTVAAVIIDPGHGGKDPGAIASHGSGKNAIHVVEKDINLSVGLLLQERLKKAFPGKKILMTRSSDTYPELSERTDMANSIPLEKNEAIIFVSIHTNASLSKKAKGFEVWYLDPDVRRPSLEDSKATEYDPALHPIIADMLQEEFTTESIIIAKDILESLNEQIGKLTENRGIKNKDWYVVKNARMPAVLIELSYLSNEEDARLLSDASYLKKLSDGIYNGLVSFIRYFDASKGFTD